MKVTKDAIKMRTDQISGENVEDAGTVQFNSNEERFAEFCSRDIFTLKKKELRKS